MKRSALLFATGLLASSGVGACGSGVDGPRGADSVTSGAGSAGAPTTAPGGTTGASGSAAVAGGGNGGTATASPYEAPDEEKALVAFLDAKQYSAWAKEADYHKSAGPHGDGVRVYYSPKAAAALRNASATFPAGAAVVKELTSGTSLYGWAVWVKVQDATDAGNGFFWYELIHQGGGMDSIYGNARGSGDCVGCHVAGKDYDLSTLPFQ